MKKNNFIMKTLLLLFFLSFFCSGCVSCRHAVGPDNTTRVDNYPCYSASPLAYGAAGAVAGAAIGAINHNTGQGALIGGLIGLLLGTTYTYSPAVTSEYSEVYSQSYYDELERLRQEKFQEEEKARAQRYYEWERQQREQATRDAQTYFNTYER